MEKRIRDRLDMLNFYQKQKEWKRQKEEQEREEEERFRQEVIAFSAVVLHKRVH